MAQRRVCAAGWDTAVTIPRFPDVGMWVWPGKGHWKLGIRNYMRPWGGKMWPQKLVRAVEGHGGWNQRAHSEKYRCGSLDKICFLPWGEKEPVSEHIGKWVSSITFKKGSFFKRFFYVGHFYSLYSISYNIASVFFVFWPRGMWDLSSPTRDWTCTPAVKGEILTTGPPGKFPKRWLGAGMRPHLGSIK